MNRVFRGRGMRFRDLIGGLFLSLSAAFAAYAAPSPVWTPERAADFGEREVAAKIRSGNATAAAFAVVSNGQVILVKSYGEFDPVKKVPFDVNRHQVLLASITKTFTATGLARLVEDGRIRSLDDPANTYLKRFKLPSYNGREVTLRQLVTHSSGIDSPAFGFAIHDQAKIPGDGAYILKKLPKLVREPGTLAVYANYGPPILGAVIEDVTGENFQDAMATLVLKPLGMTHSQVVYRNDRSSNLAHAGMLGVKSPAYAERVINTPFLAPSGSMSTTAPDITQYMLAQLGHRPDVIPPAMVQRMHTSLHQNNPGLNGMGMAFYLSNWAGQRMIYHGGNIEGFQSSLVLAPDSDLGVFVIFLGSPSPGAKTPVANPAVATDHFLTESFGPATVRPKIKPVTDPASVAGAYWLDIRAHNTRETAYYWSSVEEVRPDPAGGLLIGGLAAPKQHYDEVAPGVFQGPQQDGRRPRMVAFQDGKMVMERMYATKVEPLQNPALLSRLGLYAVGICLTGLIAILGRRHVRWLAVGAAVGSGIVLWQWILPHALAPEQFTPEIYQGRGARLNWMTGAAWLFLVCGLGGVAASVATLVRGTRPVGLLGWTAYGHRTIVAAGAVFLAYVGHILCLI